MMEDLKCWIGMHRYKLHAAELIKDPWGNTVGKALVSVCQHCGKIKTTTIKTIDPLIWDKNIQ